MPPNSASFDVVIIGAGISGLASAFFLQAQGITNIAIIAQPERVSPSTTSLGADLVMGGYFDNFTRFDNTFGFKKAKIYWQFSIDAFFALEKFCKTEKIPFHKNKRIRLLSNEHEINEAKLAVRKMQNAAFSAAFVTEPSVAKTICLSEAAQEEGKLGAYCPAVEVLRQLKANFKGKIIRDQVKRPIKTHHGIEIHTSAKKITSEIVIVAAHLGTVGLLPQLAEAFVSTHEQWLTVKMSSKENFKFETGRVFTRNHGHEWIVCKDPQTLHMGGARFLLPLAGTGLSSTTYSQKIHAYLENQCRQIFPFKYPIKIMPGNYGLDCRPCDELPIIGPMFGENRILIAGGYSGQGVTLGFLAGKCLAELITKGKSEQLPRDFWPTRLRSLSD